MINIDMFYKIEESEKEQVNLKMIYVDMTNDLISGILLSQIIYWNLPSKQGKSKLKVTYKGRKGIAKQRTDWYKEIRITDKQYDRAIKILKVLNIVEVFNTMFNGKRTPVIILNEEVFIKLYEETLIKSTVLPKGKHRSLPKVDTAIDEKVKSLTETTSKITTKNTKKKDIHIITGKDCNNGILLGNYENNREIINQIKMFTESNWIIDVITTFNWSYIRKFKKNHSKLTDNQMLKVIDVLIVSSAEGYIDENNPEEITKLYVNEYVKEKRQYYSMQEFFQLRNFEIWFERTK